MTPNAAESPVCPCRAPGDALAYRDCCGRYHEGALYGQAPDPLALMRSRYSAFVLERWEYLMQTWHSSTRPTELDPAPPGLRWLGLEVRGCTVTDTDHASGEFVARSKLAGRAQRQHEVSRFVRLDGRWLYLDAG